MRHERDDSSCVPPSRASLWPGTAGGRQTYKRKLNWSGYTWKVRVAKKENPGKNTWVIRAERARAERRLAPHGITTGSPWKSVELADGPLRYGRYRWVVNRDLSNPSNVFGLFVRDMAVSSASHGEQDIEFARWSVNDVNPGWFVSWTKRLKKFDSFPMTNVAPYVIEIAYRPRSVHFSCGMPTRRCCSIARCAHGPPAGSSTRARPSGCFRAPRALLRRRR